MKKVLAAICASFLMAGPAVAKTATSTIPVQVQVVGNCTVSSSGALDFGTYDGTATKNANTTLTVSCTQSRGVTVNIASTSYNATTGEYAMTGSTNGDTLNYTLTSDSTGSTPWADQTGSVAKGGSKDFPVYAQLAGSQDVSDDSYTDTLNVTVTY